jgi:ankyrin repeat protein
MNTDWLTRIDECGQIPLGRVAQSGRSEVATLMILQESQDQPNNFHQLPTLQRAACWGFEDVIGELLEDGVDIDETDGQEEAALHKAVRLDNFMAAKILLDFGANVNVADCVGMTPLHWAALTGIDAMVDLLLSNYANVDAADYITGGLTPLAIAKMMGYGGIAEMMQNRFSFF